MFYSFLKCAYLHLRFYTSNNLLNLLPRYILIVITIQSLKLKQKSESIKTFATIKNTPRYRLKTLRLVVIVERYARVYLTQSSVCCYSFEDSRSTLVDAVGR